MSCRVFVSSTWERTGSDVIARLPVRKQLHRHIEATCNYKIYHALTVRQLIAHIARKHVYVVLNSFANYMLVQGFFDWPRGRCSADVCLAVRPWPVWCHAAPRPIAARFLVNATQLSRYQEVATVDATHTNHVHNNDIHSPVMSTFDSSFSDFQTFVPLQISTLFFDFKSASNMKNAVIKNYSSRFRKSNSFTSLYALK